MKTSTKANIAGTVVLMIILAGLAISIGSMLTSCCSNDKPQSSATDSVKQVNLIMPQEFKNGVFYFNCSWTDDFVSIFAMSLAQFKENHPELVVVAIAPNDNGSYGHTIGYFVSCEPR
jgi:hypothetical protein